MSSQTDAGAAVQLLTVAQTAELLAIGTRTLHRWRAEGVGPPPVRFGTQIRYRLADVAAWIDTHTDDLTPPAPVRRVGRPRRTA